MTIDYLLIKELNKNLQEGNYVIAKVILFQNFDEVSESNLDIIILSLKSLSDKGIVINEAILKSIITMTENEIRCANTLYQIYETGYALKYTDGVDKALNGFTKIFNESLKEIQNNSNLCLIHLDILAENLFFKGTVTKMDVFNYLNCNPSGPQPYVRFLDLSKLLFNSQTFKDNFAYLTSLLYLLLSYHTN